MTIKICVDCNEKIFYNKKHQCLKKKYEHCSLEEQDEANEIDELTNSTFKKQFMCHESRYLLTYDGPVMGVIVEKIKEKPKQEPKQYIKTPCQWCGFLTSDYYREKHELKKKCQKIKLKYYRG